MIGLPSASWWKRTIQMCFVLNNIMFAISNKLATPLNTKMKVSQSKYKTMLDPWPFQYQKTNSLSKVNSSQMTQEPMNFVTYQCSSPNLDWKMFGKSVPLWWKNTTLFTTWLHLMRDKKTIFRLVSDFKTMRLRCFKHIMISSIKTSIQQQNQWIHLIQWQDMEILIRMSQCQQITLNQRSLWNQ